MDFFGIRLVGFNEVNAQKLILTFVLISAILLIKFILNKFILKLHYFRDARKIRFWSKQSLNLFSALIIFLTFLSIWFNDPTRLATGLGLVTAGLAFALQKVVTSFAGYLIIMRGNTFSVGERITMGGIRGDVIALGFLQTTIMEMGQPASVQASAPAMWVRGRQFTGRIVTITNDKIFETPVYNYTRNFPFIWEEMQIPIKYTGDVESAEKILVRVVQNHTQDIRKESLPFLETLQRKYGIKAEDTLPRVFMRLTDNWIELTVRFIVHEHGIRDLKDGITRDVLKAFQDKDIDLASETLVLEGLPFQNKTIRKLHH